MTDASQIELVATALYLLGGDQHVIDTEDIAVKVHELAPGRFSWRKYPEQINLELVRVYLSAAKDPVRGGGLVDGTGRSGWTLTRAGLEWAKANSERLAGADLTRTREERKGGSIDERRWQRERTRVMTTTAWARWDAGERDITPREAQEVFRIDSYALGRTRDLKMARLQEMFEADPELGPFIRALVPILSEGSRDEIS